MRCSSIIGVLLLLGTWWRPAPAAAATALKPRIIVLTDISPVNVEPDDLESMIRLFAYADQFEIEGLVATTGWSSSGGHAEWTNLIHEAIGAYEKDLPNLRKRSAQESFLADESRQTIGYWPSPEYLRARTVVGSQQRGQRFLGEGNDSPGSALILQVAQEADERPVWIQAWGGANTLAQVLWRLRQSSSPAQLQAFLRKVRLYAITDQDRGYEKGTPFEISAHAWMRREFERDLMFLWDEAAWAYQNGTGKARWEEYAMAIQGRGHLGRLYPKFKYGVEGDTPAFLYVLPNGLNDPEFPSHGGWGGSLLWGTGPDQVTRAFVNQPGTPANAITRLYAERFYPAIFNDFVARIDWAHAGVGNRNPVVSVGGDSERTPLQVSPPAGQAFVLDASDTRDPDGDDMQFSWWVLTEAGMYPHTVTIRDDHSRRATVLVPADAVGKTFHVIVEVTDQGKPPLTSYRRIIFNPTAAPSGKAAGSGTSPAADRPRVIVLSDFPPLDVIPGGAGHGPPEKRSDPDDVQSMVRLLLYANEFELEGLVATAGTFANVARKEGLLDLLGLYDQVDESLRRHDARYPTAADLRALTWQGRDGTWGKPADEILGEGKDSEASAGIIRSVDRADARPVWICVWGGPGELAQALWRVRQSRSSAELQRFVGQLRVFMIGLGDQPGQDGSGRWLLEQFPELFVVVCRTTYAGMFAQHTALGGLDWINAHVRKGHGPLGAAYPPSGFDPLHPGQQEGDSPSFLFLYSGVLGLSNPEQPNQESWGGQYRQPDPTKRHWYDDAGPGTVAKWLPAIQADFARRAEWMVR